MKITTLTGSLFALCAGAAVVAGCLSGGTCCKAPKGVRTAALDASAWTKSTWLSAADAKVAGDVEKKHQRAADGSSWFVGEVANEGDVVSAKWMTSGLGVYEVYVNGQRVGCDALKPGFTHVLKTRRSFTYDVTPLLKTAKDETNVLAAQVSAGWWRDKIVNFAGQKSAFRGVLELTYADGSKKLYGTCPKTWKAGVAGKVKHAGIFDGEEYDAREACPAMGCDAFKPAEANTEFKGEILPSEGGEICRRCDLALKPVEAYIWQGVTGANDKQGKEKVFGQVVKTRTFAPGEKLAVAPGETLVVDFGQNAAAVPRFVMRAARDTVLTCLPGEMLNDNNGERARGNDGPGGSLYRENLRMPADGMRLVYTFAGEETETYMPLFTFFGYRFISVTATAPVEIDCVKSVPVTSITKCMERGRIETGDPAVNKLISNVYWGQLSNYLSVSTDCPQRNERLGWTADTQVFCEAGSFNADTSSFFHKWMRDMRDSQDPRGGFPGVAPNAQYGNQTMRLGWSDAGVIVPYTIWRQFGDRAIVDENWAAMEKCLARQAETQYRTDNLPECCNYQWNDWLSLTKYESCAYKPELSAFQKGKVTPEAKQYWNYLGGCYWVLDSQLMLWMAKGTGRAEAAAKYEKMVATAKAYMKKEFFSTPDGLVLPIFRDMQTPALFALKLGLVEGDAKAKTIEGLKASIQANNGRLHTGFLGTSIAMDVLTENGLSDLAYEILLGHDFPGWLYSVDQGATTIWERWNSYVKETGFGPVGMNSFNHYAYGCVLGWLYKSAAGIASCPRDPGFKRLVMKPQPCKRLGSVKAEYDTPAGLVKSAWCYKGDTWVWDFTVPAGATAYVTLPGETAERVYKPGTYHVEK